jgi:protein-L-isoaspartate(D-aspartate) O-methyltransferase
VFRADKVREVMTAVDRADYCSAEPYFDSPQSIGYGATISAPHMHAVRPTSIVATSF